jgi:hypothetical protein
VYFFITYLILFLTILSFIHNYLQFHLIFLLIYFLINPSLSFILINLQSVVCIFLYLIIIYEDVLFINLMMLFVKYLLVELLILFFVVFQEVNIFIGIFLVMIGSLSFGILKLKVKIIGNVMLIFRYLCLIIEICLFLFMIIMSLFLIIMMLLNLRIYFYMFGVMNLLLLFDILYCVTLSLMYKS